MGSWGPVEVDAGLQYYGSSFTYPSNYTLPSGWGAYINNLKYANPKVFDVTTHEWHGIRWSDDTYTMMYQVNETDGTVTLTVNGLSYPWTDQKPPDTLTDGQHFPLATDGKLVYSQSQMSGIGIKRVIGMTQGDPGTAQGYTLDGSIITATYSGGQVKKRGGSWTYWSPDIVNQTKTGYDVGQDEKDAQWGGQATVKSDYILTFPDIDELDDANGNIILTAEAARAKARMDTPQSYILTEGGNTRYVHETIKISLRSATKMEGEASTVKSAN